MRNGFALCKIELRIRSWGTKGQTFGTLPQEEVQIEGGFKKHLQLTLAHKPDKSARSYIKKNKFGGNICYYAKILVTLALRDAVDPAEGVNVAKQHPPVFPSHRDIAS